MGVIVPLLGALSGPKAQSQLTLVNVGPPSSN